MSVILIFDFIGILFIVNLCLSVVDTATAYEYCPTSKFATLKQRLITIWDKIKGIDKIR